MSEDIFIFINKLCNRIKRIHLESGGFVLFYKRLKRGTFELPETASPGLGQSIVYGATPKGYDWVYFAPVEGLVLFDYLKSRGRELPNIILKDFSGYYYIAIFLPDKQGVGIGMVGAWMEERVGSR